MKYQPNSEAISFLESAKDIIEGAGYDFSWRVVNFDE